MNGSPVRRKGHERSVLARKTDALEASEDLGGVRLGFPTARRSWTRRRSREQGLRHGHVERDARKEEGYSPKIYFRCRASTFRQVCDRLRATFGEEFVNALRLLQLDQFLLMPAFKQNVPLVYMLLTKWNVKKQCFVIKGKNIPFTAEEVAMITGLPNRGADFVVVNGRISGVTANDLRHEIDGMKRSTPLKELLEKFIVYLLSNLFFPLANFRVPSSILTVAENAEEFLMYNWPASIRQFLVAEFDSIAAKHRNNTPLGYINGFVIILIIWFLEHSKVVDPLEELSRPRFVRWDSQIMYSEKDVLGLFKEVQRMVGEWMMDPIKIPWFRHPGSSWSLVYLVRGGSRPNLTEGSLLAAMGCFVQGYLVELGWMFA
ncbi:hypothetical protein M5K25_026754 [Dendrobium thyrsiflorum]|uniref:Uncharacterized protein n=1 Tax=Dendrobium thyrsiflorum TaxID=117978 RepID=A0ABD0TYI8_DENTH